MFYLVFVPQLSSVADLSANASIIFNVLLDFLCFRHLDNAVDLALAGLLLSHFFISLYVTFAVSSDSYASTRAKEYA